MGRILSREEFDELLNKGTINGEDTDLPLVYIASPFFVDESIKLIERVEADLMYAGFNVVSPRLILTIKPGGQDQGERKAAFEYNVRAIQAVSLVVALCDVPDTGTHWEMGAAYLERENTGLPMILGCWFSPEKSMNLMLAEGVDGIVREWHEFQEGVRKYAAGAEFTECFDKSAAKRIF